MNRYLHRALSAVVMLPILFACSKKENAADSGGSVLINPSALSLSYGQEATLLAVGMSDFVWGVLQEETVVQIIDEGVTMGYPHVVIKAVERNGSATITAVSKKTLTTLGSCQVTVATKDVTSLELVKNSVSLVVSKPEERTYQIEAIIKPADATYKDLDYVSADESVATVSEQGLITAVSNGETTVTVSTKDGSQLSAEILVRVVNKREIPNAVALLTPGDKLIIPEMVVGATQTLSVSWLPATATEKSYTLLFDPEGIAKVVDLTEESVTIKALRSGVTQVTLKNPYYTTSPYSLTVQAGSPYLEWDWEGLELYRYPHLNQYLQLAYGESPKPKLKAQAFNVTNPSFIWNSSNSQIVAFNQKGEFWPVNDATAESASVNASVSVSGRSDLILTYPVRYFRKPSAIEVSVKNVFNPTETKLTSNPVTLNIRISDGHRDQSKNFRQVACFTVSSSISDYVKLERDEDNVYAEQDCYVLTRKKAPASAVNGTVTFWPLGFSNVTTKLNITVQP